MVKDRLEALNTAPVNTNPKPDRLTQLNSNNTPTPFYERGLAISDALSEQDMFFRASIDNSDLDRSTPLGQDVLEKRAVAQSTADKWGQGIMKGISTFATASGQTAGVVGGGLAATGMVALGNEWDSDTVFKNPVMKFFSTIDETLKERHPNYASQAEQNASVLSNMATANFWSDKFLNGVGFMASAIITGGITAKGFKGLMLGLKGATKVEIAALASKEAGLLAVASGKITSQRLAQLTMSKAAESLNTFQAAVIGRMGESGIEANDTYEQTIQTLESARETGKNNYTDIEIEELAKDARASAFGFNMMLAIPDAYQLGKIFRAVKGTKSKSIFGTGRIKSGIEGFIIESQEENYQLAVSNMAINMANNVQSEETKKGAADYLTNIIGGMLDNFRTKEGQESMILGGLLGGPMGLMVGGSNDRSDIVNKNIPKEILKRNNQILSSINNTVELEKLQALALEKDDVITANLAKAGEFINLAYSNLVNGTYESFTAELEALSKQSVEDFAKIGIEVTEAEIATQYQKHATKAIQYKELYDSFPTDMHEAIKGNLFFADSTIQNIRAELLTLQPIKVALEAQMDLDKTAGVEIDEETTKYDINGITVIPNALNAQIEMLEKNLKVLGTRSTKLNSKKDNAVKREVIKNWEDRQIKPVDRTITPVEPKEAPLLGTLQIQGETAKGYGFIKKVTNKNNSITYTLRDEEGNLSTINIDEEGNTDKGVHYFESDVIKGDVRGNQVEAKQYNTHEQSENANLYKALLDKTLSTDPNWRNKVKIRLQKITRKEDRKARIAQFKANGGVTGGSGVGEMVGKNGYLIPSTSINMNLTVEDEYGVEQIAGHVIDPYKWTDLEGNVLDLNALTDEQFYEYFTFTDWVDGEQVHVRDAEQLKQLRAGQTAAFKFFEQVETWAKNQKDGAEIPKEFIDLLISDTGLDFVEENTPWESFSNHNYLKDSDGNYVVIDTRNANKDIRTGITHKNIPNKVKHDLADTRYLVKVFHPTLGDMWVKATAKVLTGTRRNVITSLINTAIETPTKANVDAINDNLYIAYKGNWKFKFEFVKGTRKKAPFIRLDSFNGKTNRNHRMPLKASLTNLGQLNPMLKAFTGRGEKEAVELSDTLAFRENIPAKNPSNEQIEATFTTNVTAKIVKGAKITFAFGTNAIPLIPSIEGEAAAKIENTPAKAVVKRELTIKEKAAQATKDSQTKPKPPIDDAPFKKSESKPSQVINYEEAKAYLANILPPGIIVVDMATIIDNIEELGYTWGQFADNIIYLSKHGQEGTQYHEAFHAVFRVMLTAEERSRLYKIAVNKYGKGHSPIFYEEKMADEFMSWKINKTKKTVNPLRNLFKKIIEWTKYITKQGNELEQLFRRIDRGAFRYKAINKQENGMAASFKLLKGDARIFKPSMIFSEQVIYTAASHALKQLKLSAYDKDVSKVIKKLVLEFMDSRAALYDYENPINAEIAIDPSTVTKLANLESIFLNEVNRDMVIEEVLKLLEMYDITISAKSQLEAEENEESERVFDIHQGEVGGFDNVATEIKQFIALTTFETNDVLLEGVNRNITAAVNFSNVYTALQRRLAGKSVADMMETFKEFAEEDEQIGAVYDRFLEETGFDSNDFTVAEDILFNKFVSTFKLEPIDYVQTLRGIDPKTKKIGLRNFSANRDSAEATHFNQWERQASELNVFKDDKSRKQAAVNLQTVAESFEYTDEEISDNPVIIKNLTADIIIALKQLGIDVSTGFVRKSLEVNYGLKDAPTHRMLTGEDITVFANLLRNGDSLYKKGIDENGEEIDVTGAIGRLTEIASGDINYRSDIFETNFQDAENKTRYAFVKPSFILTKVRELRGMTQDHLDKLRANPYYKYNPLIQDKNALKYFSEMSAAFVGDFRDDTKEEGVTFKSTNAKDLLLTWYGLYNGTKESSFTTPMVYEAKSTSIAVKMAPRTGGWVDKNGKLFEEAISTIIDSIFTQEHQRINNKTGIDYQVLVKKGDKVKNVWNTKLKGNENIVNPWVTLSFFNGAKSREGKLFSKYSLNDIQNNTDLRTDIANTLKEGLEEDFNRHREELVNYKIITENSNLLGVEQKDLENHIKNYYFNDFINSVSISQILQGDLAKAKNATDRVKRNGGELAYGDDFGDGSYKVVYKTEDEVFSEEYQGKVNRDDAQVYTTVKRRIAQLKVLGLNKKQLAVWEKVDRGEKLTPQETELIDGLPLKTVHYDGIVYHKMSETILAREFTSEKNIAGVWVAQPGMEKMHNMLEYMLNSEIDSIVTMSASKLANANNENGDMVTAIDDSIFLDGVPKKADTSSIGILANSNLRLQVETHSGKEQIISGTQMAQLVDTYVIDSALRAEYYDLLAQNRISDYNFAARMLENPNNAAHIAEKLINIAESTGADAQTIHLLETEAAKIGNGVKFKHSLNLPHIVEKMESLFISHMTKGVLQQKVPGYKLTLMAASGVKKSDGTDLQMHRLVDGKIELAEVMMSRGALRKILGKDNINFEDIDNINEELLKMVGTRIPTQAHHSMIPFKIVKFLPEFYGDTIIAPAEITILSGADYDIDSLFVYRKDFYIDKITKEVILFGTATTLEGRFEEYVEYNITRNKDVKRALRKTEIEQPSLSKEEIQSIVFTEYGLHTSKEALQTSGEESNNSARNNRLVEIYLEILTNPNIPDLFEPASLTLLEDSASILYDQVLNYGSNTVVPLHYSVTGKLSAYISTSTGKRNVGVVASANNVSAFVTKMGVKLFTPNIFLGQEYEDYGVIQEKDIIIKGSNEKGWSIEQDTRKDLSKTNSLSTLVSGMTDDAKHGFAFKLNLQQYNLGTFANMISLGMGFNRTMLFASQPILSRLSEYINTNEDFADTLIEEFIAKEAKTSTETTVALTAESLLENMTKDNPSTNLAILKEFNKQYQDAKHFQRIGQILSLNKGELGNNIIELNDKLAKIGQIQTVSKEPHFTNINEAIAQNANARENIRIANDISKLLGKWFISGTNPYKTIKNKALETIKKGTGKSANKLDRAIKTFLTMQGLKKLGGGKFSIADLNGLADPALASKELQITLANIINEKSSQKDEIERERFNSNEFIKILKTTFKITPEGFINPNNKSHLDLVESNMRIKRSPFTIDRIMNGFLELTLDDPKLGQAFFRYALVKDNLQFINGSFTKFLDISLFNNVTKGIDLILDPTEEFDETLVDEFITLYSAYKPNAQSGVVKGLNDVFTSNAIITKTKTGYRQSTKDEILAKIPKNLEQDEIQKTIKFRQQSIKDVPEIFSTATYNPIGNTIYTIYKRVGNVWEILPQFGDKYQQPYHMTYEEALQVDKARNIVALTDKAPVNPKQEIQITEDNITPALSQAEVQNLLDSETSTVTAKFSKIGTFAESEKNKVQFTLKAINLLQTDKAKQVFEKGKKNNWDLNKILTELQIPKEQKQIILDKYITDREEIITSLLAENSFVVVVKTATRLGTTVENPFTHDTPENTEHYSNLTVPGGTNYTENEISTPLIIPNIKGHAQFSTDNGIGWFRSDETSNLKESYKGELQNVPLDILEEEGLLSKTRRILEIQSDLFQKGRENPLLTDEEVAEDNWIQDGNKNQFLQLLNKKGNWVNFFIQSIVQDSVKKGYKKVVFPTGETAAKVEGHETLAEDLTKINEELALIKNKESDEAKSFFKFKDFGSLDEVEEYRVKIEKEKQSLKTQGIEKLKPIEAFYENRVTNILNKLYTVNQITDEIGNTWNEVDLSQEKVFNPILLQKESGSKIQKPVSKTLNKKSTVDDLVNYNFSKVIKKLTKQFGLTVELIDDSTVNWKGRYQGGVVFLNLSNLTSDTPFHEFSHPFIEAIKKSNPALYEGLVQQILKEGNILNKVKELYPELDEAGQLEEAIVTAIGIYAADATALPKTLINKIKAFLKSIMNFIRSLYSETEMILPEELNVNTTLRDLSALMTKGDQVFKLDELTSEQAKYQKDQATKLTVQGIHVDQIKDGSKVISLREINNDIIYKKDDILNVYSNGKQQGVRVKVLNTTILNSLNNKNRDQFAQALGYENYAHFISTDEYVKIDSKGSKKFPSVYRFLQGEQPMQIIHYEVVEEFIPGKETELSKKIKDIREALVKEVNRFTAKLSKAHFKEANIKLFINKRKRLLKALDSIDEAAGMMAFIDTANNDITASFVRLKDLTENITDLTKISDKKRKFIMGQIYEIQELMRSYHIIDTVSSDELNEYLGDEAEETLNKFREAQDNLKNLQILIDKKSVPMLASWLLSFSNVDSVKAKKFFEDKIIRLKKAGYNQEKLDKLIKQIQVDEARLHISQETLEQQIRTATKDIGFGSLYLEAAMSSSDQVTSLFAKAIKHQEFEANLRDMIVQQRLGVALDNFEEEQGKKGTNITKFYQDLLEEVTDKDGITTIRFKDKASTPAGEALLKELRSIYAESQLLLPDSHSMGDILPFIRKESIERAQSTNFVNIMKEEWRDITTPLSTDTQYGYQSPDGKAIRQIPIFYTHRGDLDNKNISKDLVSSILKFAQMAHKYNAYKEVQSEVDLFEQAITKRKVDARNATGFKITDKIAKGIGLDKYISSDSNRVNERIQEFINMQYYGVQEKPWIIPVGENSLDVNKLLNFLGKWTGFTTLALNFLSAINNVIIGNFYIFQESLARQHFGNMKLSIKEGKAIYSKGLIRMFGDIGKLSGLSKEIQLVHLYDAMQGEFRSISGDYVTGNNLKKAFSGSAFFFANHAGEHEMQVSTLFSALAAKKLKTTSGEDISLWDAYSLDSKGKLQLRKDVKFTDKEREDMMNQLHAVNKSLHGNYNDFDKTVLQKYAIGRLILMFRKFMAPGFRRRFGELNIDNESGELHQGFLRQSFNLLFTEFSEVVRFATLRQNSLTDFEKANLIKTIAEIGMWVTTMMMFALASAAIEDDDDKWLASMSMYQLRRFQSELSFYFNPGEFLKIFKNPAAVMSTAGNIIKFGDQLLFSWTDEATRYQTSGDNFKKGDSKLWADFKKLVPVIHGVERSANPQQALNYFNKLF